MVDSMTIKLPEPNIFDRFLHFIGKKRGVFIPTKAYENYGQYVYTIGKKENFWNALLRPKSEHLLDGFIDIYDCCHLPECPDDHSQIDKTDP